MLTLAAKMNFMEKLKGYLFAVLILGQLIMQAQNQTSHLEHYNNGPGHKPCFLGWTPA